MPNAQLSVEIATLRLEAAQHAIAAGLEHAAQLGVPVAIVVVDTAGLLLASARMNGAPELALRVATKKAWTSSQAGAPSGDVIHFISGDPGSAISMPHVQDFSVIAGGLPIIENGQRLGALGVSGASPDIDLSVAQAALAVLA